MLIALLALTSSQIQPLRYTEPVGTDPDDPAIWINAKQPQKSLIVGTDKSKAPAGGLFVFNLHGKTVQTIKGLDRPNNVDVEYAVDLGGGRKADIVAVTERNTRRLIIYRVNPRLNRLEEISGNTKVLADGPEEQGAPMGIALYRKPGTSFTYAFVSRKENLGTQVIAQYQLKPDTKGKLDAVWVRNLGHCQPGNEVEALFVDDELGHLYYAEEPVGYHKISADPKGQNNDICIFARANYAGDREGIALYRTGPQTGFLIAADQMPASTTYNVYRRQGNSQPLVASFTSTIDSTDGLDVTSTPLGSDFPNGVFVAMNSSSKSFAIFSANFVKRLK